MDFQNRLQGLKAFMGLCSKYRIIQEMVFFLLQSFLLWAAGLQITDEAVSFLKVGVGF